MSLIDVEPSDVEYGGRTVRLLAVKIDGQLVSNQFPPFDASAKSIGISTCLECYVATSGEITFCGSYPKDLDTHDVIGIRRHNRNIVWFHQHDAWFCPIISNADKHQMWFFDIADYESKLGGDSSLLPDFNSADIRRVIRLSDIPDPQKSIYRNPVCDSDSAGRKLMTLIHNLANDDGLEIVDEPQDVINYEIGFERNCDPEVVFDVGAVGSTYAFRLRRNPAFPLWVTSSLINVVFPEIAR